MSVLLLVRHGQASFGKSDYDALSDLGHHQARVLGRALAGRGVSPDVIVRGELRRHRETAEGILEGLRVAEACSPAVEVDMRWDEFDFQHVMEVHNPLYRSRARVLADYARIPAAQRNARFQAMFEEATSRWTGGGADDDYHESFPAFSRRVDAAVRGAVERVEKVVLVVSSGGPISLVAAGLIGQDSAAWTRLNRAAVNTGVTKILRGAESLTLSTYNEHSHLEHDRSLITYR